jgi:hypothetical protein
MYADLPLGINLVEDPSFESGMIGWSSVHTWLPGTASPSWAIIHEGGSTDPILSLKGTHVLWVEDMAPTSAGMGGVWYDLGILPAGTYTTSVSLWVRDSITRNIKLRAGRANGGSAPAVIGTATTSASSWQTISGDFVADGINPQMILIRNEEAGSYVTIAVDMVAAIHTEVGFQLDLYQQMSPVADQDAANDFALKRYLRAYSLMFEQIDNYVRDAPDGTPGWATISNPMTAPAESLDWLSQVSGTVLPFGIPTPDKRTRIRDARGRERGTRNAIVRAVQEHLTGTKYVAFLERSTDNDHFKVGVLKSESPSSDWFVNLLSQSDFEGLVNNWLTSNQDALLNPTGLTAGGSFVQASPGAYQGDLYAGVTTTAPNQGISQSVGTRPAGTYAWRVALRSPNGTEKVRISIGDPAATMVDTHLVPTTLWTIYSGTYTHPGGTIRFNVENDEAGAGTKNWSVDAVQFGLSAIVPTDYFTVSTQIIKNAVESERAVGFFQDNPIFLDSPWSYFAIQSTIIVTGDPDDSLNYAPVYPTYRAVKRHFTNYEDLTANTPHSWENIIADFGDPTMEKSMTWNAFGPSGGILGTNVGVTLAQSTSAPVYNDTTSGRLTTPGTATNQGMAQAFVVHPDGTFSANIQLRAVGSAVTCQVLVCKSDGSELTSLFSGSIGTGAWTQVQGQFDALTDTGTYYLVVRVPAATAAQLAFDDVAVAPGVVTFPAFI